MGPIFVVNMWVPLFNALVKGELRIQDCSIYLTTETSLCRMVQSILRYLEPFRRDSRLWRTDRQTDGQSSITRGWTAPDDTIQGGDTRM